MGGYQLTESERYQIYVMKRAGRCQKEIVDLLNVSTIDWNIFWRVMRQDNSRLSMQGFMALNLAR